MKDLGQVRDILGMRIDRDGQTGSIRLSRKRYIEDLLEKFNMKDCKNVATPMEVNERFVSESKSKEDMERKPYRELIGSLIYLANATRPDIAFATNVLNRFYEGSKIAQWKAAKRVLRYLRGTTEYAISYGKSDAKLVGYIDADWAEDTKDRRSCTGYVMMLANGPISWCTRKQRSVALSTMEAE